ncbi:hypothetical protein [Enterococcus sp. BWR-S5]|uniref:hypothetical protein n=1 Tax=Enterococcus sp. BWR-S5 TaxID=2787714 RepID=UPI0019210369|nr:hypothetical protein [Enterococcus sp. BWR-S5]MBL1224161.1 hypothetical protein [Enterococcus sp. BWR-S5]
MKKIFIFLSIMLIGAIITGCKTKELTRDTNETETTNSMVEETNYTQSQIDENKIIPKNIRREERGRSISDYSELPFSNKKKEIDEIQSLIVYESSGFKGPESNADFVVDFKSRMMYLDPFAIENYEPDWKLEENDVLFLKGLIEKYNIQDWESKYGKRTEQTKEEGVATADGVGYHWMVILVDTDETISKHEGYMTTEQFDNFHQELMDFREEQREKWRATIEE